MTLGDDVMSVVPDMRLAAESMMIDEGTITRPSGDGGTTDPVTGEWIPDAPATVYTGRARLRQTTAQDQQIVFGDINTTVSRYTVSLPHDAPLVEVGDIFKLTETSDPEVLNVSMRVVIVVGKSVLMYRQLGVEVVE